MPTFIGTLSSAPTHQPLALAAAQNGGAIVLPPSETSSSTNTPISADLSATITDAPTTLYTKLDPVAEDEVPWTPSEGRKLDTGLSIVLENVASGFRRPNVLDVKLGARLWADDAPPAKRAKLDAVSKETTSGTLGFRIAGMKVWTGEEGNPGSSTAGKLEDITTQLPFIVTDFKDVGDPRHHVIKKDGYSRYDKWYGRCFNPENVKQGLQTFFAGAKGGQVDRSQLIARRVVRELRHVQHVLESEEIRMYSSSVLIIYEGDPDALEEALQDEKEREERKPDETDVDEDCSDNEDDGDDDSSLLFEPQDLGNFEVFDVGRLGEMNGAPGDLKFDIGSKAMQLPDIVDDEVEEDEPSKVHDLRLIDFAHARWTPGQGPDENVLLGVQNLVKIMEDLASEIDQADNP